MSRTGRYTRGTGCVTPLDVGPARNPVDLGWWAVRTVPVGDGNSRQGLQHLGWEATVKVYGVAVAMPQG